MTREHWMTALVFGCLATACSLDDSAALDGGSTDSVVPDATTPDSSLAPDAPAMPDTGPIIDAGADVIDSSTVLDASPDVADAADALVTVDADASDASDAADAFDATDSTPPVLDYPHQVTAAWCHHLASCCGSGFNETSCYTALAASNGFDQILVETQSVNAIANYNPLGSTNFDPDAAASCLADIASSSCAGDLAARWLQTRRDCFAAVNGVGGQGTLCRARETCAPGLYCQGVSAVDPSSVGVGHCQPILSLGGNCALEGDYACTYQANGIAPEAWCSSGVCTAQLANGSPCTADRECTSGVCAAGTCAATQIGATLAACAVAQDAGSDQ